MTCTLFSSVGSVLISGFPSSLRWSTLKYLILYNDFIIAIYTVFCRKDLWSCVTEVREALANAVLVNKSEFPRRGRMSEHHRPTGTGMEAGRTCVLNMSLWTGTSVCSTPRCPPVPRRVLDM